MKITTKNRKKLYKENMLNSNLPYCFLHNGHFDYSHGFLSMISKDEFEKFFNKNLKTFVRRKDKYELIFVNVVNGCFNCFKMQCFNHYDANSNYLLTSVIKMGWAFNLFELFGLAYPNLFPVKNIVYPNIEFSKDKNWKTFWLFCFGFSRSELALLCSISEEAINKRLKKIKVSFKSNSLESLRFEIIRSGSIFKLIPCEFKGCFVFNNENKIY